MLTVIDGKVVWIVSELAVEAYATIGEICGALREVFEDFKQVRAGSE